MSKAKYQKKKLKPSSHAALGFFLETTTNFGW